MGMRTIDAQDVVSASKFNRFHLLVFVWCFYLIGFDGYDIAMYGVGLSSMMAEWNLTPMQAGAVGSYSLIGMMLGALVLSPLADKFGRKNAIVLCMFLFSAFTLAAGFSPNLIWFTVMRFISAIGMGGLMPNCISLMTEYSPKKNRPILVGSIYIGYALGGILASLIGMFLIQQTNWRILYYIGGIPLLTIPLFIKYFPESLSYYLAKKQIGKVVEILNKVKPDGDFKETDDYKLEMAAKESQGFPVKKLFTNNRAFSTIAFWMAVFCTMMIVYGLNTWLPKLMQDAGFSMKSSLSFNMVVSFGQIIGTLAGGYFANKIGHKRVLVTSFALGIVAFIGMSLTSNIAFVYILIFLAGVGTFGGMNLANPYIAEYYPREIRATGSGYSLAVGRIGSILAPTLIAMLITTGIDTKFAFALFAVPCILVSLGYLLVQEKYASFDKVMEENDINGSSSVIKRRSISS
ncbi:MFS transporter [Niallia endozanthoxylica]|uniref:MFS transporter n=2 Tax=Niallia endozanthoxylica TaxID=2036016 RepID=A0A5J5HXZ5_9BACI|nr:MFS transporter [Niallia endozanthoxylica]